SPQTPIGARAHQIVELRPDLVPRERLAGEPGVARHFAGVGLAALDVDRHPARSFARVACSEAGVRLHLYLAEQRLDVRLGDTRGLELRRLHVAVGERDGQEIWQAVIGVLLRMDVGLRSEAPTA